MRTTKRSCVLAAAAVLALSCGDDDHEHGPGTHTHGEGETQDHEHGAGGHEHGTGAGGHEHGGGGDHGHGHGDSDEVTIGITRWTDRLELFAEHPVAVVGQEVEFLAHLTVLEGFRALEEATVSLELDGPGPIRAAVNTKLRPGIFKPVFTPRAPGTHRGRLVVRTPQFEDAITPIEIEVYPDAAAAARAHPPEEDPPGRITFLKEQQWRVPFATAFAAEGSVSPSIEVPGTVGTPPAGTADVGATLAGRIVPPSGGLASPGTRVRAGQVLATIAAAPASPEGGATAGLAVAEAEARLATAESALARAERLFAERAIAQREVDAARREVEVARAAVAAARRSRAVFSGGGTGASLRLTAPIDGVVAEVLARPGQAVEAGTVLFRIVDPRVLWIVARIPEADAARVRSDSDARYQVVGSETWTAIDVTAPDATAELVDVSRVVDPATRTVTITWALRAPDPLLRIGGAVQVAIPVGAAWRGVVVPRTALVDDDGRDVVYVQVEGEAFEERQVRVGPRAGDTVGIEDGLRAGERVTTTGANLVRLASRATTAPGHGHVH